MKMDVGVTLPKAAIAAIAAAAVILFLLLAWIGGEMHYRNCIAQDELVAQTMPAGGKILPGEAPDGSECSRWPF